MVIAKTASKSQRNSGTKASKRDSLNGVVSDVAVEKRVSSSSDANVSVFTKTTNPNVVINSEDVAAYGKQRFHKHRILKSVCLIVMGIIILMTFFLSLKTYNAVNELYQLFNY